MFPLPVRCYIDTKGYLVGTRKVSRKGQERRTEYKEESPCTIRYDEKDDGKWPLTPLSATRKSTSEDEKVGFIKRGLCRKKSMVRMIEGVKRIWSF